jgi:hypothetical protein
MQNTIPRKPSKNSHAVEQAMRQFRANNDIALLARKMGKSHVVLTDKLNPDRETHKLCLLETASLTELSGDMCLLEGLADFCGLQLFEPPTAEVTNDKVISLVLRRQRLDGHFAELLEKALDDGEIDPDEAADLLPLANDLVAVVTKLVANLQSIVGKKAVG